MSVTAPHAPARCEVGRRYWWYTASRCVSMLLLIQSVTLVHPLPSDAQTSSIVTPLFFGVHVSSTIYQPWPVVSFGTIRTWDHWPGISWKSISCAPGVYDWSILDHFVEKAIGRGVDIIYTFGVIPSWASTNPAGGGCAYGNGTCYPPDVDAWKNFVTVITTRYTGKIKYWELWNEPNVAKFWNGTSIDLVSLAAAAYPIIKAAGGVVVSPSPQGANAYKWLDSYFEAGGYSYLDVVAFHGYLYGDPEQIIDLVSNVRSVVAKYDSVGARPIWDTEHNWGDPTWPFGATGQQAAWLARFIPLSFANGIARSVWYMWDGYDGQAQWGMLYNAAIKQLQEPGVAYREVYGWMVNADLGPCSVDGATYQCPLTRVGGYEGLITWIATADPTYVTPFTAPEKYTQYRTLDGRTLPVASDRVVPLGMKPVLLEKPVTGAIDTLAPSTPTEVSATSPSSSE